MSGVNIQLDLYYPPSGFSPPHPLVVFVHGGGWFSGDKKGVEGSVVFNMTAEGFVVGSVNYRLAPQYQFPAQIEDVKCAIRFLRFNAAALEIDPNRIGVIGESAGGQIASLLGVTGSSNLFDVGQYYSTSSAVTAVAVISGPENLTAPVTDPAWVNAVIDDFDDSQSLKLAGSPVNYPNPASPPFLLEYGYNDTVVPYGQGIEFNDVLRSVGVNSTLILVNNAGHVLVPYNSSLPEVPSLSVTKQDIVTFFTQQVKNAPIAAPKAPATPLVLPALGLFLAGVPVALLVRQRITSLTRKFSKQTEERAKSARH